MPENRMASSRPARGNYRVIIYRQELERVADWTSEYLDCETGGDLFGFWTNGHNPAVHLALGPGPRARRHATAFFQDRDYLERLQQLSRSEHGLQHIGSWHSHHNLNLRCPSSGDVATVVQALDETGFPGFLLFIVTFADDRQFAASSSDAEAGFDLDGIEDRTVGRNRDEGGDLGEEHDGEDDDDPGGTGAPTESVDPADEHGVAGRSIPGKDRGGLRSALRILKKSTAEAIEQSVGASRRPHVQLDAYLFEPGARQYRQLPVEILSGESPLAGSLRRDRRYREVSPRAAAADVHVHEYRPAVERSQERVVPVGWYTLPQYSDFLRRLDGSFRKHFTECKMILHSHTGILHYLIEGAVLAEEGGAAEHVVAGAMELIFPDEFPHDGVALVRSDGVRIRLEAMNDCLDEGQLLAQVRRHWLTPPPGAHGTVGECEIPVIIDGSDPLRETEVSVRGVELDDAASPRG